MKKLVAIALSMMLLVSSIFCITASAAEPTDIDTTKTGTLTLTKYDGKKEDNKPVKDATFTAYRILDIVKGSDGKVTYEVNSDFNGQVNLNDVNYSSNVTDGTATTGAISYGTTTKLEAQISKLEAYAKNKTDFTQTPATATTNDNGVATFENLALGVYLVVETTVPNGYVISTQSFLSAIPTWQENKDDAAQGEWNYAVEAQPKNQSIKVEKTFKSADLDTQTRSDSYVTGSTIPYIITAPVPNYGQSTDDPTKTLTQYLLTVEQENDVAKLKDEKGVEKFNNLQLVFEDTLSKGLTLDESSLKVKIDGEENDLVKVTEGKTLKAKKFENDTVTDTGDADYTVTMEEVKDAENNVIGHKFTVTVSWSALDAAQGKNIVLTYNAQLNKDAVVGSANTNDVTYSFSNNPKLAIKDAETQTDPTRPEDPPKDHNDVYTYQLDLTKKLNNKAPEEIDISAANVTFQLLDKDGNTINVIKEKDGVYTIWNDNNDTQTETTTNLNPKANGKLSIKGFAAGQYQLKETASVDGYTLLTSPIDIYVYEVNDATGDNTKLTAKVSAHTMKYDKDSDTYVEDTETELAADNQENAATVGHFLLTVNNAKNQFNLPVTGGAGLLLFTIGGGITMVLGIVFFLHSQKRKKPQSN